MEHGEKGMKGRSEGGEGREEGGVNVPIQIKTVSITFVHGDIVVRSSQLVL